MVLMKKLLIMKSFRILIIYVVASCLVIACNLDEIPDNTGSGSNFEASFDHTDSCNTPFEVIFTNTSSFQGDSFLWDFGDTGSPDNTSALEHPSHIYSGPGTYTVELTVDSSGTSSVFSMNIDVELITFERTFGGGVMDSATAVVQAPDGGFFITGYSKSKGNDILIYKTNRCNDDLIYTSVGGTGSSYGNSISLTNDGGYLIAGRHSYFGHSGYVVRLNSSGNSVQALENSEIKTYAAIQLNNNDIIIAGSKKTTDGFYDSRLFKTNGNLVGLTEFTGSGGYIGPN